MKQMRSTLCLPAILLLLAGCATTPPARTMFLLDQSEGASAATPQARTSEDALPTLKLSRVTLAPFLTHQGIVYQTGPNRIAIADNNQWAAPLQDQITTRLYKSLDRHLAQVTVLHPSRIAGQADFELAVNVETFQGRYDGNAVISGAWRLFDAQGQLVGRGVLTQNTPLNEDGYTALVRALSRGWQTISQSLASDLARILKRVATDRMHNSG